jgi:pimeloyl-ACP methyl ester carboxylesterase
VDSTEFDDAVADFLHACAVPRQLREPRIAERLAGVDADRVPSRHGDLSAWRLGSGPAALLVHGYEDDNSLWSPLIDALADQGRSVVAFDLPAHGSSEGEWGLGWEGADGIHAVRDALGPIDAVVGHSVGCMAVVGAVAEGLQVDRAAFVAPPLGGGSSDGDRQIGDRWQRYGERLGAPDDVVRAAREAYDATHRSSRQAFDALAVLDSMDTDLLVIHSTDDERMPYAGSATNVPRWPLAELVTVGGLNHRRTARDPEVVRLIAQFLSQ